MSFVKRLWHSLTAFFYLRIYELLFEYLIFVIVLYVTEEIAVPSDLQGASRSVYALRGALGFIVIYYLLFRYVFISLLGSILLLRVTPFFRRTTLAATNALIYAIHSLWIILSLSSSPPFPLWVAWFLIVIFNVISVLFLPRRLFDEHGARDRV